MHHCLGAPGPTATTSATTSWPITWGEDTKFLIGFSRNRGSARSGSAKLASSKKTTLDSEPQMPVSRGSVTTQSGRRKPGSGSSTSRSGLWASIFRFRLSGSGSVSGSGSGSVPKSSACTITTL